MEFSAVWNSAPFGIQRRLEFSAVWNSAPFGIQRPSAFPRPSALSSFWHSRRLAFSAVNAGPLRDHRAAG